MTDNAIEIIGKFFVGRTDDGVVYVAPPIKNLTEDDIFFLLPEMMDSESKLQDTITDLLKFMAGDIE